MKLLTANDLASGRVIYWSQDDRPTALLTEARMIAPDEAEGLLARAQARPDLYVNPYLIEVEARRPSGRDRLKEAIRADGPTVGHSRRSPSLAEIA